MGIVKIAAAAKSASIQLAATKTDVKNNASAEIAKALKQRSAEIVSANKEDLAAAKKNNLSAPLLKRLAFDENKIANVCAGIDSLIKLENPSRQTQQRDSQNPRPRTQGCRSNPGRYSHN